MESFYTHINAESKLGFALCYENNQIIEKFASENDMDLDWNLAQGYFLELKKFLFLCSVSDEKLAPSSEIDKIWHTFILFTKEYRFYCLHFLGKFIDHVPNVSKVKSEENYLVNTVKNYNSYFGEINEKIWQISDVDKGKKSTKRRFTCDNQISLNEAYGGACAVEKESSGSSCAFTGSCFDCTDSGQSCVGENPNDL